MNLDYALLQYILDTFHLTTTVLQDLLQYQSYYTPLCTIASPMHAL